MFNKVTLIVNPIAGGVRSKDRIIRQILQHLNPYCNEVQTRVTRRPGEATQFAVQSVRDGADLVLAVGGDGTVNEIGTGLVNSEVTLGLIPVGSGNGLARSLNIPSDLERACEVVTNGRVRTMDVGRANEKFFFLVFGIGFDAVVGKRFADSTLRGPVPYFYYSFKAYFDYQPEWLEVSFNSQAKRIRPFVMAVANGQQYGNGAIIAPEAKLNDGLFDICIVHRLTALQAITAIPKLFQGKLNHFHEAEFHKSPTVRIVREGAALVNIDGEPVIEDAVVEISILPNSLKIIAPENSPSLV